MEEIELKFLVPEKKRAAVLAALQRGRVAQERLQAYYFDTADERLAAHRMALRVRKEGRQWMQTLKAATPDALRRLEHNVPVSAPARGTPPSVDLALHDGGPAGAALRDVLGMAPGGTAAALTPPGRSGGGRQARAAGDGTLTCRYGTDIRRTTRQCRRGRSRVELAFDVGWILAGQQRAHVCELEFELISGSVDDLLLLAGDWVRQHGLVLSTESKSERGTLLSHGERFAPPAKGGDVELPHDATALEAACTVVRHSLAQVLSNGSALAAGSEAPEHVHQIRVGLRRLRTALSELRDVLPPQDPSLAPVLRETFKALGDVRDRQVVIPQWERTLQEAGAPPQHAVTAAHSGGPAVSPAAIVGDTAFQQAQLALLRLLVGKPHDAASSEGAAMATGEGSGDEPEPNAPETGVAARRYFARRLERLHHRVERASSRFDQLSDDDQHRVRRQLKRLRYLSEFAGSLFPKKPLKTYLKALRRAQDALGRHVDLLVALHNYRANVDDSPHAAFATGWLTASRASTTQACRRAMREVAEERRYWKSALKA